MNMDMDMYLEPRLAPSIYCNGSILMSNHGIFLYPQLHMTRTQYQRYLSTHAPPHIAHATTLHTNTPQAYDDVCTRVRAKLKQRGW